MKGYLTLIAVGVVMVCCSVAADAATIRGSAESCGYLVASSNHLYIRSAFDSRTWEEVRAELGAAVYRARNNPASYVRDDDDVAYVLKVFERVWRAQTDVGLSESIYDECVKPVGRNV